MKNKNNSKSIILSFFLSFLSIAIQANELFGGIEIGSKGVKMTVIDVINAKKGVYELKNFWTENVGIATGISIDGNLIEEDIELASTVVLTNYTKLLNEFKIADKNIFIVASSGVGMAKNTDILVDRIKQKTKKPLEIISSQLESKLLFKGCVPPKSFDGSLLLDIGGGNTKGGYIDTYNDDNLVFNPMVVDVGTITLTEEVNKKNRNNTVFEYSEHLFNYLPKLREKFDMMYKLKPKSLEKQNIYLSGGAVWAFYTLFNGKEAEENFNVINFEEIVYHKYALENNFKKYEELAKTDKEVAKVIKTYSLKHLMAANNILITMLENLPSLTTKKIYFAKQGQIAWLLSYVADSAKGSKPIY
jgi:exopolyphosphatase/pppGpp-phosphohydrolase